MQKIELTPAPHPSGFSVDQMEIWNHFEQAKIKCIQKNMDYGSSVFKAPRLNKKMLVSSAIIVRMCDKLERIENLLNAPDGQQVKDESVVDTMLDLAAYCHLWIINHKRTEG